MNAAGQPAHEHLDVVVVGAGLSGIGAAARLRQVHPQRSVAVLEARGVSGGTWDLFRYPGVRSDSDRHSLGYRFRPWRGDQTLVAGADVLAYLRETARETGVDRLVRYHHRLVAASWDSVAARWTLTVETPTGDARLTTSFLWLCGGYFDYERGHQPDLPGLERFAGRVVHPQAWPADLDHAGARVVVVGSGATAVTLVPALAEDAAHVTMLQRSPSYVLALPSRDPVASVLWRVLPARAAYALARAKTVLGLQLLYRLSRRRPGLLRSRLRAQATRQLPAGFDVDTHFAPRYDPWDQRLCLAPDGDLFRAIRQGRASVVTGTIRGFTATGVAVDDGTRDGCHLEADLLVTATGLRVLPMGGVRFAVDGEEVPVPTTMTYRSLMLSGLPNLVFTMGYPNHSWTLKADLVSDWVCLLLRHLDRHGFRSVVPVPGPEVREEPATDFTPGYLVRAARLLPRTGDRDPWRLSLSYLRDRRTLTRAALGDGVLRFGR